MRRNFRGSVWFVSMLAAACQTTVPPPPVESAPAETASVPTPAATPAATTPSTETTPARTLTPEVCGAEGGQVVTDPGDGSLSQRGCPEGRARIGNVRVGIEGGLCCAVPVSAAPAHGKRAPCTFGADQTCNADASISALHGHCTELGTCECRAPAVLTPGGFCKMAP